MREGDYEAATSLPPPPQNQHIEQVNRSWLTMSIVFTLRAADEHETPVFPYKAIV